MDLFKIGQKISIFFTKDNSLVEMSCVIETIYDDRLDITLPQYFMRYIEYLQVGCEITAKVFSKMGTVDFNSIIISSPLEESFTIELDYNSVQLTKSEDVPVIKAMENIEIKSARGTSKLKTFELASDYFKFYSNNSYNVDEELDCIITLPKDYGIINFKASVSEIDPIYENEYTAVYTMMTENDRQTLLYYMYMYSKDSEDWESEQ